MGVDKDAGGRSPSDGEYLPGEERRMAFVIASDEPNQDAPVHFADAVMVSARATRSHSAFVRGGKLEVKYCNGFGPTVAVDDIIERMTMVEWKRVCMEVVRRMLQKCGHGDLMRLHAKSYPTVLLVAEDDSPVIAEVRLSMWLPKKIRVVLEASEFAQGADTRSPGPLQGEIVPHDPTNLGAC